MNRSGRLRRPQIEPDAQKSRLLKLPPELRNLIYECAARTTQTVTFRDNKALYTPALSLVCHQIREEYRQIYLEEAPRCAPRINVNITNFITRTKTLRPVSNIHDYLPPPAAGVERLWTLRIIMTNFWDRHRLELRNFIESGDILLRKYDLEIVWDPKTFDAEFLRENVQRLRFCFGRVMVRTMESMWPQVEKALVEAFVRYAPSRTRATQRKRERTKVEVRKTPHRKQKHA